MKNIPELNTFFPPAIISLQRGRFALPGWIPIDDDVTLEDLNSKWKQPYPTEAVKTLADNVFPVLSSKGEHEYYVTVKNNSFSCTCPGYGFRRRCKHVDQIKNQLNS